MKFIPEMRRVHKIYLGCWFV